MHNIIELNIKLKSEAQIKASGAPESVISDNLDRLHRIQNRLSKTVNFAFYIKNTLTNEIITNVTPQWGADSKYSTFDNATQEMLAGTPYEVYAAVIEPLKPGDVFYDDYWAYTKIKSFSFSAYIALVTSLLLMSLAFLYLVFVTGRREKGGEIVHSLVDKIYTDVYSLLVFIAALLSVAVG